MSTAQEPTWMEEPGTSSVETSKTLWQDPSHHKIKSDLEMKETEPLEGDSADQYPEGGIQAWLTVMGSSVVLFSSFGVVSSFGTFQTYFETYFLDNYSSSLISMIGSLQLFLELFCGVFFGRVFDATGVKYLLPGGGFCIVLALLLLSVTERNHIYQQFLCFGILLGVGVSMGFFAGLSVVTQWFHKRRSLVIGIVIAGSSAGGTVFPIILKALFETVGFAWAVRTLAAICFGCYLFAWLTVKTRLPPSEPMTLKNLVDFSAFKDMRFTLLSIAGFLVEFSLFNPFFYIELHAIAVGISEHHAKYLLSIMNASSLFGRVIPGIAADRYGRFNTLVPLTAMAAVLVLGLWLPATGWPAFVTFAVLYGFFSGSFIGLAPSCIAQIVPQANMGANLGANLAVTSFASLLGNPIAGAFLPSLDEKHFRHFIIFTGAFLMLGVLCLVATRIACTRQLWVKCGNLDRFCAERLGMNLGLGGSSKSGDELQLELMSP
ncbi:hypothetical protein HDU88_007943 [Geranomyces variabilis]|nr:hypothetical protein HDU88_007943 [Geranomyces variabilis]